MGIVVEAWVSAHACSSCIWVREVRSGVNVVLRKGDWCQYGVEDLVVARIEVSLSGVAVSPLARSVLLR